MDLDTPIDVLITTAGQKIDGDDTHGPGSLVATYLSRVPEYPAPKEMQFQVDLERLTFGHMPGSLQGEIPDPLYVYTRGENPNRPLDMAKVHYTKSLFVVSNKVKSILESLRIKNSEFYPVSMVYSTKGINSDDWGGGAVVAGTHWLWWCFATFDLVDIANTEAVLTPQSEPNRALPDAPIVSFHHLGKARNGPQIRVSLQSVPYEHSAAFTILGWSSTDLIVSPAFVSAFTEKGLVDPDGPINFGPLPLDRSRYAQVEVDFSKNIIPRKPPLRIFGTSILVADRHDPPFHARRSPYFPLSGQNS